MARSEVARSEEYNAGRGISVSLGFQRLLQFFARATYVKPAQLSAGNGPLGPYAGDDLICIAQNCAHNGAIQSACGTCFDAPSQIQGGDCRQPGAALRRTLLHRHDEASDLDLGASQSPF